MKFSWNSLRMSWAGARLSHLVRKDGIWDHGSMIEVVKSIFLQVEKSRRSGDTEHLRKYLTAPCYEMISTRLTRIPNAGQDRVTVQRVISEVVLVAVREGKGKKPDQFQALVKGRRSMLVQGNPGEVLPLKQGKGVPGEFVEEWLFSRQGNWWLLEMVKTPVSIFRIFSSLV